MNKRSVIAAIVGAVALAIGLYFWSSDPQVPPQSDANSSIVAEPLGATAPLPPLNKASSSIYAEAPTPVQNQASPTPEDYEEKFHADSSGKLVVNEKTRLHIESLVALNDPRKLEQVAQSELQQLPPGAAAKANELIDRYRTYLDAQKQSYPPGVAPADVDDAIAQLDGLHALRIAHFGAETAEAFYGEEEKLNRELLELMRLEKEPGLSMDEKAVRSQAMRDKLHRVSEIEKRNREIAAASESGKNN